MLTMVYHVLSSVIPNLSGKPTHLVNFTTVPHANNPWRRAPLRPAFLKLRFRGAFDRSRHPSQPLVEGRAELDELWEDLGIAS